MMQGRSGGGCQTSITASHTSTAQSISVLVKLSGEYWNDQSVCGYIAASRATHCAPRQAMALTPSRSSVLPEYSFALRGGGRVVDMHDGPARPPPGIEGAQDQVLPSLDEHLDDYIS